jgi:hypothetical protein
MQEGSFVVVAVVVVVVVVVAFAAAVVAPEAFSVAVVLGARV